MDLSKQSIASFSVRWSFFIKISTINFFSFSAKESSLFTVDNVIKKLNKKLIDRHPNVFGFGKKSLSWEEQKHIKKKRKSRLDGVPLKLPALVRSQRLQQKASEVGFDWDNINSVWDKVYEELDELKEALEQGDVVETLDALTDLQYVLDGAYLSFGLQDQKMAAFTEVHRSNMSKLGEDGKPIRRESDGKVLKGPDYFKPDLVQFIKQTNKAA